MSNRLMTCVALAALALGGTALAGGKMEKKQDRVEIGKDKQHLEAVQTNLKRLSHVVDLWHDANLKGDQGSIGQCSRDLYQILQEDITATQAMVSACEREVNRSAREFKSGDRRWTEKVDDRSDLADDNNDLVKAKQMLGAKKRLLKSWTNSQAFSNRYRLVNDYLDLMRNQAGLERMELVEDIGELHEDR